MKLCMNCRKSFPVEGFYDPTNRPMRCLHEASILNYVNGELRPQPDKPIVFCQDSRTNLYACGHEAKWFEPKES